MEKTRYKRECGRRLRAVRSALGYDTIRAFADLTGVEEDTLGTWESGRSAVPYYYVAKLKRRFGVTFDWIFDGDPQALPHSLAVAVWDGNDQGAAS